MREYEKMVIYPHLLRCGMRHSTMHALHRLSAAAHTRSAANPPVQQGSRRRCQTGYDTLVQEPGHAQAGMLDGETWKKPLDLFRPAPGL